MKTAAAGGAPAEAAGGVGADGGSAPTAQANAAPSQPTDPAQASSGGGESGQGGGAPSNAGWVIQITGHHFHNEGRNIGPTYVQNTLVNSLNEKPDVELVDDQAKKIKVSTKDLGIEHALIVSQERKVQDPAPYPNPNMQAVAAPLPGAAAPAAANRQPASITLRRFDFKVQ